MTAYTYRATQVEQYRRYMESEYISFDDMVATLSGTVEENEAMRFGTNVHHAIDRMYHGKGNVLCDLLDTDSLQHNVDHIGKYAMTELMTTRQVAGNADSRIMLRGTADAVSGNKIIDFKTTQSSISERKIQGYQDSMQWKCYLWLFGAATFEFVIQQWSEKGGIWAIVDEQIVRCDAYAGMERDVERMVLSLHGFATLHGLLQPKEMTV